MNRPAYIYKIENKVNGNCYIGSTVNYKSRWAAHKTTLRHNKHHSFVLQKAWNKHGENNFEFKLLVTCDKKDMIDYEKRFMALQSYNILRTPKEALVRGGWHHTPDTLARMSTGIKKAAATPETKERMRNAHLGRKWPKSAVEKTARAKWKPVFCKELGVSFLNQKYAAEYIGLARSTITEALKREGKVNSKFTFVRVA